MLPDFAPSDAPRAGRAHREHFSARESYADALSAHLFLSSLHSLEWGWAPFSIGPGPDAKASYLARCTRSWALPHSCSPVGDARSRWSGEGRRAGSTVPSE